MDIEATKRRCELVCRFSADEDTNLAVSLAIHDLPDAIELIEEAEDLLLDARPVIGGDSEAKWCKKREAFFAKVRKA